MVNLAMAKKQKSAFRVLLFAPTFVRIFASEFTNNPGTRTQYLMMHTDQNIILFPYLLLMRDQMMEDQTKDMKSMILRLRRWSRW